MNYKLKILLFLVFVLANSLAYGQMIAGNYPFQVLDSLIFERNNGIFQIDTTRNPDNFISTQESDYQLYLQVDNDESESYQKRINEIHLETNIRDFIAGITNYSLDTIWIPIQDKSVISILEAKDENGLWKPIQFWPISGCGDSYYSHSIPPGQSLLFTVKKDFGEYTTQMRLRLHATDTILISQEFLGSIDASMFKIKENVIQDYTSILCDSIFYLETPIYGNLNIDEIEIAKIKDE